MSEQRYQEGDEVEYGGKPVTVEEYDPQDDSVWIRHESGYGEWVACDDPRLSEARPGLF